MRKRGVAIAERWVYLRWVGHEAKGWGHLDEEVGRWRDEGEWTNNQQCQRHLLVARDHRK